MRAAYMIKHNLLMMCDYKDHDWKKLFYLKNNNPLKYKDLLLKKYYYLKSLNINWIRYNEK